MKTPHFGNGRTTNKVANRSYRKRLGRRPSDVLKLDAVDLFEMVSVAQGLLQQFFQVDEFSPEVLSTAFGTDVDESALTGLMAQLSAGDFSSLPTVEVRTAEELQDANGVYVAELDKIYVSADFLAMASSENLVALLLEEIGHAIDAAINETDSAGDEGNIFANLVLGIEMTATELSALQSEDDSLVLTIGGQTVEAEASRTTVWNSGDLNDAVGSERVKLEKIITPYYMTSNEFSNGISLDEKWSNSINQVRYYDYYGTVHGTDENDIIWGSTNREITKNYLGNRDTFTVTIQAQEETLYGNGGDDYIDGGDGDDIIFGDDANGEVSGNDILRGGAGADTIDGGGGNDVIFTGDLSEGSSDSITGGAGADTFYMGEITSSSTTTNSSAFDFGSLALSLAGDATNIAFTAAGPQYNMAKAVVPMVFDGIKALLNNDWNNATETIEDATAANYAQIMDFNPLEDIIIVSLAVDGDPNVSLGDSDGVNDLVFTYANGSGKFGGLNFDESLGLSNTAQTFYQQSLIDTALILDSDGVEYGGNNSSYDLTSYLDSAFLAELSEMNSRFMILGAYAGQIIEGDNGDNYLYGTNHDDVLYGYTPEASNSTTFSPGDDDADHLWGYGGNDLFYAGNGANYVYGGAGSDTVSYAEATDYGITVNLLDTETDANGTYVEFGHGFSGSQWGTANDKLYSIENIIGTDFDDSIVGDANDNTFAGLDGNDTLNGGDGTDTVAYGYASTGVTINLSSGIVTVGSNDVDTISNFENVIGSDYDDIITGDSGDNVLIGGGGNDTLDGGAGSDTVDYSYAESGVYAVLEGGSSDFDFSGEGFTFFTTDYDTLTNIENIVGTDYTDDLFGNDENNVITGSQGDDRIDGNSGTDTAVFSGNFSDYTITNDDTYTYVTDNVGMDGTDRLKEIEKLAFNDYTMVIGTAATDMPTYNINDGEQVSDVWTLAGAGDVDGDGDDDVLWRHSTGDVCYWEIEGGDHINAHDINDGYDVSDAWTLAGAGDVDGDGDDDVLWRHSTGDVRYWEIEGGDRINAHDINDGYDVSDAWTLAGAGDVDGDGDDDLLWRHSTGDVCYWEIEGGDRIHTHDINDGYDVSDAWTLTGTGDIDGDGDDDLLWHNNNGTVNVWEMQDGDRIDGGTIINASDFDNAWTLVGAGDFQNAGHDDLLLQNSDGQVFAIDASLF